jgi:hypothetical protein
MQAIIKKEFRMSRLRYVIRLGSLTDAIMISVGINIKYPVIEKSSLRPYPDIFIKSSKVKPADCFR